MYKKFTCSVISGLLGCLLLMGTVTFAVDPLFHYRASSLGLKPIALEETYQNPGMARNFEYDTIITGSSMTENFRASWFQEAFGCKPIKTTYEGGYSKNYGTLFTTAFKHNSNIKNIFYGLDINALISPPDQTRSPLPYYLYDENKLNDIKYLLNKDVFLKHTVKTLMANLKGNTGDLDNAHVWDRRFTFSKETVMKYYIRPEDILPMLPDDSLLDICNQNLNNIIPHIESHPQTQFYIFFPPYSILFWDTQIRSGKLDATLNMLEYASKKLISYKNVKLFYFQNNADIITNLNNYKDYTHYGPEINRYMLRCFVDGTNQMTLQNYKSEVSKMRKLAKTYDYEALFSGQNP